MFRGHGSFECKTAILSADDSGDPWRNPEEAETEEETGRSEKRAGSVTVSCQTIRSKKVK